MTGWPSATVPLGLAVLATLMSVPGKAVTLTTRVLLVSSPSGKVERTLKLPEMVPAVVVTAGTVMAVNAAPDARASVRVQVMVPVVSG